MFARVFQHMTAGGAFATAIVIVLIIGSACRRGVDNCDCGPYDHFVVVARGADVIPLPAPADTSARASATFNSTTLAWTFNVSTPPPSGTIDSIAIYAMPATAQNCTSNPATCSTSGAVLPGATNSFAAAILCAGAAACAATSGTATLVGTYTTGSLTTLLRTYGGQLIVFTTTVRSGGVMRGTMYLAFQ